MYQSGILQKLQRAVDGRRGGLFVHRFHFIQQLVGFHATFVAQQQFQHLLADGGQAHALFQAAGFCLLQALLDFGFGNIEHGMDEIRRKGTDAGQNNTKRCRSRFVWACTVQYYCVVCLIAEMSCHACLP